MSATAMQKAAQEELRRLIDQLERIEEDKKGLAEDARDKLKEAKNRGFDPKVIKKILSIRKKSKAERDEEDALLATYMHALDMQNSFDFAASAKELEPA